MKHFETIIIGGGPAGSSCAWKLKQQGRTALILDKQNFPRLKLCAGWITSKVLDDLEFTKADYPYPILDLKVRMHVNPIPFSFTWFPTRWANYSIRRTEFDHWLLERSGTPVVSHHVKQIVQEEGLYIIDNEFSCKYLVGAGGTMCPVRRTFFSKLRRKEDQIATLEKEFEYPQRQDTCHLFFFYRGLKGYSWYVPKGNGHVNIGIGGLSVGFRKSGANIHDLFKKFLGDLVQEGLLDASTAENLKDTGHPYYLYAYEGEVKRENCFLIGDSAGLASVDMGEGIGPAIESGLMVANEIGGTASYQKRSTSHTSFGGVLGWLAERFWITEQA